MVPAAEWRSRFKLLALAYACVLAAYYGTSADIVRVWYTSSTFNHCFLIVPIALFMIYERRDALTGLRPGVAPWALPFLALNGVLWLAGDLLAVAFFQHVALVGMVVTTTWLLLGTPVTRAILFPLAYLFFCVPEGEFLVPYLQDLTAEVLVTSLRATGMPVLIEGRHLTIPSGQFVVAEACSGINYLLATLAVGAMFAYLRYRSLLRRTLFMILALLVPLVANGLRAYGIVMIAHYSDYKYAMGVDHFIYGWVFFGVVIFALFTLGSLFADDEQAALPRRSEGSPARSVGPGILAVAALILALPPLMTFDSVTAVGHLPPAPAPEVPAWTSTASENPFGAVFPGAGQHLSLRYGEDAGDAEVLAEIFHFPRLGRGRELAKQSNVVFDEERAVQLEHRRYAPGGGSLPETVNELRLRRGNEDYLLWYWYEVNGRRVATRIGAKLAQARSKLLREPATGAALILATAVGDDDEPRAVLARFVGATGLRVTVDDGRTEQER